MGALLMFGFVSLIAIVGGIYFYIEEKEKIIEHKNLGKSSMSFWTALTLSFNNLLTKKGRTALTSFAGSIGIIGIALILAIYLYFYL